MELSGGNFDLTKQKRRRQWLGLGNNAFPENSFFLCVGGGMAGLQRSQVAQRKKMLSLNSGNQPEASQWYFILN